MTLLAVSAFLWDWAPAPAPVSRPARFATSARPVVEFDPAGPPDDEEAPP